MTDGRYDTPRAALQALENYTAFERVAVAVLQQRGYPGLVITESTSDLGRDGFVPASFGDYDETVLLASTREDWSTKLDEDLDQHLEKPKDQRPETAIFATSRRATEKALKPRRDKAGAAGVTLDVWPQSRLALELEKDDLRAVAERELQVRPAVPRKLQTVATFRDHHGRVVPGFEANVVGRESETEELTVLLETGGTAGRAPVVLLVGPAGVGKTRLAVDVAHEHSATLVAPASVRLLPEDLTRVPVDEPAVLVVDDAHYNPDLSALAALLGDSRWDRVAVMLTARPGLEQAVLRHLGAARSQVHHFQIRPLGDRAIDEIVRGHGVIDEAFRRHVIQAASGIPLVAHTACTRMADQRQYHARDTAEILRVFVESRLQFLDQAHDQGIDDLRRATAIAVAAFAGARNSDRTALAALAPAIASLPREPDRLDRPLNDLLEAGLIGHPETPNYPVFPDELDFSELDDPAGSEDSATDAAWPGLAHQSSEVQIGTHIVHPDAAGPVLLADALTNTHRVRLDLAALLPLLGRHATFATNDDDPGAHAVTPILGVLRPAPGRYGLHANVAELGTQLGWLAQAVDLADDQPGRALLRRAVAELTETHLAVTAWTDVVTLVGQAARAVPALISDVRRALLAQWPPLPSPSWWINEDPHITYRSQVHQLLKLTSEQLRALEHHGPDVLMSWVLDTAWLAHPVLDELVSDPVVAAARTLSTTRSTQGADTVEAALARRTALRRAISSWLDGRLDDADQDLAAAERAQRPPATAIQLACSALQPLVSLLTDELAQVPGEPDRFVLTQYLLTDVPGTADGLDETIDMVIDLLDRLLGPAPRAASGRPAGVPADTEWAAGEGTGRSAPLLHALRWIVECPRELVAEGARGFGGGNAPLPDWALATLRAASDRLTAAIADRWDRLPLLARHGAAGVTVRRAGTGFGARRRPTLIEVASHGDPVAVLAAADNELAALLTIVPVDGDMLSAIADEGMTSSVLTGRRTTAQDLGAALPLAEVLTVLELAGEVHSGPVDFVAEFATAAGEAVTDPQPLLVALSRRRIPADICVLTGALRHHSRAIGTWLLDRASTEHPDAIELALDVASDLPADIATAVFDRVAALVSVSEGDDNSLNRDDDAQPGDGASDSPPGTTEHLARRYARALVRSAEPVDQRLDRLHVLGRHGPEGALTEVILSIGHVLQGCEIESLLADATGADLGADLVFVISRTLEVDAVGSARADADHHSTAYGAVAMLIAAPKPMAELLYARAHARPHGPIPPEWRPLIDQRSSDSRFASAADELATLADNDRREKRLPDQVSFAVTALLRLLRGRPA